MTSEFTPAALPSGIEDIRGVPHMQDAKGNWKPVGSFKPQDILQHETVLKIMAYAVALHEQVARFKAHTFEDIGAFEALLAQEYEAKIGGPRGNKTLLSADGRYKIVVQVSDRLDFGPELQTAKALFDECLDAWSEGARPELQGLISEAFNTDKTGTINRSQIFMLLRYESEDETFKRAQEAIKDALRVVGQATYVRCYRRKDQHADWEAVTIDLAKA
ncbi:MAG: DUF3164 family protein [Pseudomonadota bacterium]